MEGFVPIFAMFAVFGSITAIVFGPQVLKYREKRDMQETIRHAVDKGQQLPPELIDVLTKDVQKQGEEAKIAVRNVRRDAMDKFKAQKKAGELTEDDQKNLEEEVQKLTDKFVKEIDATCARKNQEIMEV